MLADHLAAFDAARTAGPFAYPRHSWHDGGQHELHVVIGSMVHGDEVGSLPAVVRLMQALADGSVTYGGKLTVFVGNPEAGAQDRRFLESDLNRVFVEEPPDTHEGRRARELLPILDAADVFLDLHQTILHTDRPFYIFPWSVVGWQWARAIGGAHTWVTRPPTEAFSAGTCCADEYVRLRGKPGITLELGPKGFDPAAEERAWNALVRLLALADRIGTGESLEDAAAAEPDLQFVQTTWRCRFDDPRMHLRPGLVNFEPARAGEILSAPGTPEITAPMDGMLLFPKYAEYQGGVVVEPRPGEIVRIVTEVDDHPLGRWPDA